MRVVLLAAVAATIAASAAAAGGAPSVFAATTPYRLGTQSAAPSCSLASPKKVKSALGLTVGAPVVTKNGPVTVCLFMTTPALLVRFQIHETAALFAFGRKGFDQHGEPTKTVSGLGTKAYSASAGKSSTIVVLQNKTELLVTGTSPLPKLVTLAKLILPTL